MTTKNKTVTDKKNRIVADEKLFGFHAPVTGGLSSALVKSKELACNAVQIFSRNPRGWTAKPLTAEDALKFQAVRAETQIKVVAIHTAYLPNLASPDAVIREKSRIAFREEIERAIKLEADYLIVHPGSAKGAAETEGVRLCGETLGAACFDLELKNLRILIENTAGQGDCIGHRFEHLRDIIAANPGLNLGVCFDTAHAFATGFNLRESDGLDAALKGLEVCIGLQNIPVIHFNDSKTLCGSRVDRHANIGDGEIGASALGEILQHESLAHAAFLLETPHDPPAMLAADIAFLQQHR